MKFFSFALIPLMLAMSSPPPVAERSAPIVKAPAPVKQATTAPAAKDPLRQLPPPQEATARQAGQAALKVYKVRYADVNEVAEVIPLMMPSTNGFTLSTVDNKLVVRGTPEQHDTVRQMLRDLDAPPKNIQVNVQFATSGGSYQRELGVRPDGPIVIRDGNVHGSFTGTAVNQSTTTRENTTQMIVASEGRTASIRVGERVPYVTWLTEYGHRWGYVRDIEIEWRDVGSFLAVRSTIIAPGLIRVRLTPELSGRLENGDRQSIEFTHLATEVTVADGQTISIGGFNEDKEFSSRFLIGRGSGGKGTVTGITLTPRILQ